MGPCGLGESPESHPGATECESGTGAQATDKQALKSDVYL